ncbi:MAG: hypothetical protein WCI92_15245 [Bacteroidota bacterium]
MNRKKIWFPFALIVIVFLTSCGSGNENDPFANMNFLDDSLNTRIDGYFDATLGEQVNPKSGNPKVYIDFSDGLYKAYTGNADNPKIIEAITQKLVSPQIEWLGLGIEKGQLLKLAYNSNQLFNKVTDPLAYKGIMAPIQVALDSITSSKNDALLVTDFEEYTTDGKEQFENYAKTYFIKWLAKGNSITFYITNYSETNKVITTDKHLYFAIFNYGSVKETSFKTEVEKALEGRSINYKKFNLSNSAYELSNNYGGAQKSGIYYDAKGNNTFEFIDSKYVNGLFDKKKNYEFISVNLDWKTLAETVKAESAEGFKDFLRKLILNASDNDSYAINELDVVAYDVTDDFSFYNKCNLASLHSPKFAKDNNGKQIFAEGSDDIAKACYDESTGKLKPEWIYKPKGNTEYKEIFSLNSELFSNNKKDDPSKIEIGVQFHPNFDLSKISNKNGLLRIDIVIKDCAPNISGDKLSLFQWKSAITKDKPNTSLYESVRNTLQDNTVIPKGKIIYSFYLKTLDQ